MIPTVPSRKTLSHIKHFASFLVVSLFILARISAQPSLIWEKLQPLPDPEGFADTFAGVSGNALIVAGGANFPDKKPWEGGTKVWHDAIFVLEKPDAAWKPAGTLPGPRAYGASFTAQDSLLCFGGSDSTGHHSEGFRLAWRDGKLTITPLPPLPSPCANMAWASAANILTISGGIAEPLATACMNTIWRLDLDRIDAGWKALPPCPGAARMLAAAATIGDDFYLFGGASLAAGPDGKPQRTYLSDAWRYSATTGWKQLPNLPRPVVAPPTPAPAINGEIYILSGDDGTMVNFRPLTDHPGFPKNGLAFNPATISWRPIPAIPISRATATTTTWNGTPLIISGELRPGIRSPEVWRIKSNSAPE